MLVYCLVYFTHFPSAAFQFANIHSCFLFKMEQVLRIPPAALAEAAAELRQCLRSECEEMCAEVMEEQQCHQCDVLREKLKVNELDAAFMEEQNVVLQQESMVHQAMIENRDATCQALRAEMETIAAEHRCEMMKVELREEHAENRVLHMEMSAQASQSRGRNSK